MTPSASPTTGVQMPECSSRELVDLLVDDGEQTALLDAVAIEMDDSDNNTLDPAVTGWGCSIFLPKPPTKHSLTSGSNNRTKKGSNKSQSMDIDIANIRVRCVNDDYNGDHHGTSWKANVEPGTYRYITNNGIYRSTKFANTGNDWITAKRSRHSDSTSTTARPDMRQAQKTLKKDLSQHFQGMDAGKSESATSDNSNIHSRQMYRYSVGNITETNHRAANVSSAVALSEPTDRPFTRETFKDPQLVKSASDLFVEKFSTRMDALQKSDMAEMQAATPAPRTPGTPLKPGSNTSNKLNEHQHQNNSDSANKNRTDDDISKDIFTVKSVPKASPATGQPPLKPLEKLTPQQKNMDRGGGSECSSRSHNSTTGETESPIFPSSFMNVMSAFAQLQYTHNIHGSKDSGKTRSGPSTYRREHKNSLGTLSVSSAASENDSLSSVRNALTMTNSSIERMRMRPYARESAGMDFAVKDYGKFLSGKYRLGASSSKQSINSNNGKPPHPNAAQRKGIVGYRPNIPPHARHNQASGPVSTTTASSASKLAPPSIHAVSMTSNATEDANSNNSESNGSYLSGTSMRVHRGSGDLREHKPGTMALPEIAGKRLPVSMSSHRML